MKEKGEEKEIKKKKKGRDVGRKVEPGGAERGAPNLAGLIPLFSLLHLTHGEIKGRLMGKDIKEKLKTLRRFLIMQTPSTHLGWRESFL